MRDPDWKKLRHAYGSAKDLPELLAALDPDPRSPVWGELWGRVCHQDSTFSASPYVLPFLLAAAEAWPPRSRAMPLALAGGIVAASETQLKGFGGVVKQLGLLARNTLGCTTLKRSERIPIVQAMMSCKWGSRLGAFVGAFERRRVRRRVPVVRQGVVHRNR